MAHTLAHNYSIDFQFFDTVCNILLILSFYSDRKGGFLVGSIFFQIN